MSESRQGHNEATTDLNREKDVSIGRTGMNILSQLRQNPYEVSSLIRPIRRRNKGSLSLACTGKQHSLFVIDRIHAKPWHQRVRDEAFDSLMK